MCNLFFIILLKIADFSDISSSEWAIIGIIAASILAIIGHILTIIFGRKKTSPNLHFGDIGSTKINKQIIVMPPELKQKDIALQHEYSYLPENSSVMSNLTDNLNKEIDNAASFINRGEIERAKKILFQLLGKIESQKDRYKIELSRIYNNLGVCFRASFQDATDIDEAIKYYITALELNPDLHQSELNLASVYLMKVEPEYKKKAFEISERLWNEKKGDIKLVVRIRIQAIYQYKSANDLLEIYNNDSQFSDIIDNDDIALFMIGDIYLGLNDFEKATYLAEKALNQNPRSPQNMALLARAKMVRAQQEKIIPSSFESVPKFSDYKDIEKALELLLQSLEVLDRNDKYLANQIEIDIRVCLIWLNRANEAKDRILKIQVDKDSITPEQEKFMRIQNFEIEFRRRNFESALDILIDGSDWASVSYSEKRRLAYMFFEVGAIEQSAKIFDLIESEAETRNDVEYWINISLLYILQNDKKNAIKSAEKAKNISVDPSIHVKALQNYNAIMLRYASSGESDRLMAGISELQKKLPDEEILKPVKALDEKGQITEEMKNFLNNQRERYENIRRIFTNMDGPSYMLEEIFNRPFADIISWGALNGDPEFRVKFAASNTEFYKEISENLKNREKLVFDYSSLLNASKMGILGLLVRLKKKIIVSNDLFVKIQSELMSVEQQDLRQLWNYLRNSKEVDVVNSSPSINLSENIYDIFDEWIIDSLKLVKEHNASFVTDDLPMFRVVKNEDIRSTNSLAILRELVELKLLDDKMYSECLGDLAERLYIFLPFNGDNLYYIIVEDKAEVTLRSFHLINQMFLPGSNIKSFTTVLVRFIDLIWNTSFLPGQKINLLRFVSDQMIKVIDRKSTLITNHDELIKFVPDFGKIWLIAIEKSNRDELLGLQQVTNDSLSKPYLDSMKKIINSKISSRLNSL